MMNSSGEDERRLSRGGNETSNRGMVKIHQDHSMLQTEVKKSTTHYPYKEPRIDQKMYQAEIPSLKTHTSNRAATRGSSSPRVVPDLRPGQLSPTENCVWSPAFADDRKVDRFLLFGRNLLQRSSGDSAGGYESETFSWRTGVHNGLVPNESDETALEFLHKHAGDVRRAAFHVAVQVGCGTGVRSLEVNEAKRGPPQQLAAWQSGYGKRLDALGFFESADAGGYTYPSELVRKAIEPSSEEDDTAWDPDRLEDGEDAEDDEAEAVVGGAEEEAREVVIPVVAQSQDPERSRRGTDRAAFKNRWNVLQERIRDIRHSRKREKPTLADCVAILDEAASLPPPEQAPGEDFVERAQQAVSAVWQMTTRAREWVANVSDVLYPGSDPRMLDGGRAAVGLADLQKLLLESHSLPVRVAEADEVTRIIRAAVDWQHKADEALAALQTPTRTRSGRGSAMQLTTLRDMLHEAQLIPVRLDQRIEIKERVESVNALATSIRETFPPGRRTKTRPSLAQTEHLMDRVRESGVEFPESLMLRKHLDAVNEWLARAQAALEGSVQLRELEKLLAEAEKLAVEPGPKLPELQAKMDKALGWLEKVRKAVPKQRSTRRTMDTEVEKVDLSHVKGLLNSSSSTGVEMDMKEFSHTNDLIESAEEWMARVREVLESGEPATLNSLESLLLEAEGIPVTMDEQQLLTAGIKARQWRLRVDNTIKSGKAKVQDLQELASKGAALRSRFPKDAKNHRVYRVLDDSELQALLKRGEGWTRKAKLCLQSMQAGRGVGTTYLSNLLKEAVAVRLNLAPEMSTLRDVVGELNQWRADHEDVLRPLKLWDGLALLEPLAPSSATSSNSDGDSSPSRKTNVSENSKRSDGGDSGSSASTVRSDTKTNTPAGDGAVDQATRQPKPMAKITQPGLHACLHAAERIAVGRSLKEVREIRAVQQNVAEWMEQCQGLCPRRQSKRRVQPANKPTIARLEEFIKLGLAFPVEVSEDISRIRSHINEAENWRVNARAALEKICKSFAEQTQERMELWRKEEEEERKGKNASTQKESKEQPAPKGHGSSPASTAAPDAPSQISDTSGIEAQPTAVQAGEVVESAPVEQTAKSEPEVAKVGQEVAKVEREAEASDAESDAVDREDELDELEEKDEKTLEQMLNLARDISVFMPEEILMERIQKIMQWARSVRESASYAGDGLQLSQAKDIVKVREGVLDLSAGEGEEAAALTATIVQNLQIGIDCYKAKVEAIRQKLREAEAWTHKARDIMTHESITVEQFETLLKEAQEVGVENEDLAKKIRAELGRCRAWMNKADDALKGSEKPKASLVKKLLAEGEKIKTSGSRLKELKHHMKTASKWLQRLKKTGIEKGTASITELKALIPEAASIRIDLSDDVRVLKQATCSYCICNRPGEDLGLLVECTVCGEGYHVVCMGIPAEKAELLRTSKEAFQCIRCRINSLFTSAEQAMLTAMKRWMPSTCFADQAGFEETPSTDDSGRDRWQASQNFAALAGVVRDAMNLPRKKIRTSLGVLSEVDNNINALTTLPWGKNKSGEEQHGHAREMLCSLRVLLWCTMAQWAVRKPPSVILLYDLVSQGQQLSQVDHDLLDTLGTMARRASLWEAAVRDAFCAPKDNASTPIDVAVLCTLLSEAKHIPVNLPLEPKVVAALEDGGNRYCLCRGPNDGSFMVGCDTCEEWFHGACVKLKEGEGKNLTNFECPGCAERKGVPYAYGKVDMEALRERAGAAAPVAEVVPQTEEEPASSEPASKTCTWPPPEAEYFFGTLDLTQLPGSDPAPPQSEPQDTTASIVNTNDAYHYQDMQRMPRPVPQAPPAVEPEAPHIPPQYTGTAYSTPTPAASPAPAQYGAMGYHYQHYPHAGGVDPFRPHGNEHYGAPMAPPPQPHHPESYAYSIPPPATLEAPVSTDESRKRSVHGDAQVVAPKRVKTDDPIPAASDINRSSGTPGAM